MERELKNPWPLFCLPSIGYLKALLNDENRGIALGEKFEKQTERNRFHIAGPNGSQLLSIPLIHTSCQSAMAQVQIDYSQPWNIKHWRSIETAYKRAPFFEFYAHYFESLFLNHYFLLSEWNLEALKIGLKIVKQSVNIPIVTSKCQTLQKNYSITHQPYNQVFIEKNGFLPNLSMLDLIFNEGPMAKDYFE